MASPNLQMFRSDNTSIEVGTYLNPIDFGICKAGEKVQLEYDCLLFNDKTGVDSSEDASNIEISLDRMDLTVEIISDGSVSQYYTLPKIPIIDGTVLVNSELWTRVESFSGQSPTAKVYTLNYTTGELSFGDDIQGAVPPNGQTIEITYTPDSPEYGKFLDEGLWFSVMSNGVVSSAKTVSVELASKISNTQVQLRKYPTVVSVVGVWDNILKTGVNYYTGGSFNPNTGYVTLGTDFEGTEPYIEYSYAVCDDGNLADTTISSVYSKKLEGHIPSRNAKRLRFFLSIPADVDTLGGISVKVYVKVNYTY